MAGNWQCKSERTLRMPSSIRLLSFFFFLGFCCFLLLAFWGNGKLGWLGYVHQPRGRLRPTNTHILSSSFNLVLFIATDAKGSQTQERLAFPAFSHGFDCLNLYQYPYSLPCVAGLHVNALADSRRRRFAGNPVPPSYLPHFPTYGILISDQLQCNWRIGNIPLLRHLPTPPPARRPDLSHPLQESNR